MEEWRDVPGIPYFKVTRDGRVKTKPFVNEHAVKNGAVHTRHYREREITPILVNPPGYLKVSTLRDKKRPRFYVHRLVALAFLDGYQEGYQVNHKNGIKTDNRVENLEWVQLTDNIKHAWETGLCDSQIGELNARAKLTANQVVAIREALYCNFPINVIARLTEVSPSTIKKIANNEMWVRLPVKDRKQSCDSLAA